MLELAASASTPIIVIGCIIIITVIISCLIFAAKRKCKQKVNSVATKTKQMAAALDELFKPVKRNSKEAVGMMKEVIN